MDTTTLIRIIAGVLAVAVARVLGIPQKARESSLTGAAFNVSMVRRSCTS